MNLYIVGFNRTGVELPRLEEELRRMVSVYPSLDPGTLQTYASDTVRVAAMSNPTTAVLPRKYFHASTDGVTLYSGLPIDPQNVCRAHESDSLARHWPGARDRLAGTYAVIRATSDPETLEIQTDLLGGEPVYYCRAGSGWLISNSVLLLERLTAYRELDPLGISTYLALGPVLADRTLREGIRVVPQAQRWSFSWDDPEPARREYWSLLDVATQPRRSLRNLRFDQLASDMQAPLRSLAAHFSDLNCPLTGGKDSRGIAALLLNAGIDARYTTFGEEAGDDVRIARKIARHFGLEHEVMTISSSDVEANWDDSCLPSIRATDGMRSLYLIGGIVRSRSLQIGHKEIYIWGACGELARSFYGRMPVSRKHANTQTVIEKLAQNDPVNSTGLIQRGSLETAYAWRKHWIDEQIANGMDAVDVPDVFGNFVVDGRRLGNNGRALAAFRDTFAPYATRAFFDAALSLSQSQRCTEPLHYGLVRNLVPELHTIEIAKDDWYLQNALLHNVGQAIVKKTSRWSRYVKRRIRRAGMLKPVLSYDDSTFHRVNWFESERNKIRNMALDSTSLSLWDFVNKDAFERVTSDKFGRTERSRDLKLLFHIATLLYYETDPERRLSNPKDEPKVERQLPAISHT